MSEPKADASAHPGGRVRFVVYTALLFASWHNNLLALPCNLLRDPGTPQLQRLGVETNLVFHRVARADAHPLHPLIGRTPDGPYDYRSQVGLSGVVLAAAKAWTGIGNRAFVVAVAAGGVLLTAAVVALIFVAAHRRLGPPVGDVACALAALSPVLAPFAPSPFWVPFLMLLPFAVVWCLGDAATTPARQSALAAAVGVAVLLKCLCGYEYVTAVILAPVAAAWFHQHVAGVPLCKRAVASAGLVAVGLTGFVAALALHIAQGRMVFGDDGLEVIRERAVARTNGPLGSEGPRDRQPGEAAGGYARRCFLEYTHQPVAYVPAVLGRPPEAVSLWVVAGGVLAFAALAVAGRGRLPRTDGALAGAAVLALVAGLSWQVLAVNHMCVHRHLNLVVFTVPFLPVAFVAAGYAARLVTARVGVERSAGWVLLAGITALMTANAALAVRDHDRERTRQRRAEAVVAGRLDGPPPGDPSCAGAVDARQPITRLKDYDLIVEGLFGTGPVVDGPADPGAFILDGWAVGDWGDTPVPEGWEVGRPTARLVVTADGVPVRCRVTRGPRPDVDRLAGGPKPGAAFRIIVPSPAARPGVRLRVFAVSDPDPSRVSELRLPP